ncbi:hypothetical protein ACFQ0B_38840 [Nonomuraea thailandensis]
MFWRRLRALPPIPQAPQAPRERVIAVLREIALLVSDEPELAAACTTALLGTDPDVRELRLRIGRTIHRRLLAALDPGAERPSPEQARVLNALEFAYAGALVHAGMGYSSYAEMADRLAEVAGLLF